LKEEKGGSRAKDCEVGEIDCTKKMVILVGVRVKVVVFNQGEAYFRGGQKRREIR